MNDTFSHRLVLVSEVENKGQVILHFIGGCFRSQNRQVIIDQIEQFSLIIFLHPSHKTDDFHVD